MNRSNYFNSKLLSNLPFPFHQLFPASRCFSAMLQSFELVENTIYTPIYARNRLFRFLRELFRASLLIVYLQRVWPRNIQREI